MRKRLSKFAAAAAVYAGFAGYLYQPYLEHFSKLQYLVVINAALACLGCYVLSRRWVLSFWGSLFAGAIYGFGPLCLCLAGYHPAAGTLAAAIPWLFLPAVYPLLSSPATAPDDAGRASRTRRHGRWANRLLAVLPFAAIVLFFQVSGWVRLFAIPVRSKLDFGDLGSLLAPLVAATRSTNVVGFYHVPVAPLILGICILLIARRWPILAIFTVGTILGFSDCLFGISPIIWLTIPVLCCSVLIGVGMQAIVSAGAADRLWLLTTALIMALLSAVTLRWATLYTTLFIQATEMYVLGAVTVFIVYFMARAKLRVRPLRLALLCSAMAANIFLGARFIVDRIF